MYAINKPRRLRKEEFDIKTCLIEQEFKAVFAVQGGSDHIIMHV